METAIMAEPDKRKLAPEPPQRDGERRREERQYDKQVADTFPASDPPADSEPGGGITGPEPTRERHQGR
jgi:hypothetical protein